jgi:cysteine synthase A
VFEAGDFDEAIRVRDKMANVNGWFNCNQFQNPLNIEVHYKNTGPEINKQFREANRDERSWPQAFVAGTGTGGTIMGCGEYLKEKFPGIRLVAVEPAESAVMSGGEPGLHGIQGIGDGSKFLVDLNKINDIKTVHTECAKKVAKHLALKYGLFVGISAGANVMAADIPTNNPYFKAKCFATFFAHSVCTVLISFILFKSTKNLLPSPIP